MNILSTAPFRKLPIGIQSFLSLIWQTVVRLVKIGISFDSEERNLGEWIID